MVWGAALGAAASLAGGLIAKKGQEEANARNIALSREQMAFQERMSSSAYQRATQDLEKSGLNRILAIGSPASTPVGAKPNVLSESQGLAEGVSKAPSSAQAALLQAMQRKQMQASIDLTTQQVGKTIQDRATSAELQNLYLKQIQQLVAQTSISNAKALQELMWTQQLKGNPNLQMLERIGGATGAAGSLIQSLIPGGKLFGRKR